MFATLREKFKGWKTIWWNGLLVVGGIVATIILALNEDQISALLPDPWKPFAPLIVTIIGLVGGGLRMITTGPVGSKGDEAPDADTKAGD